MSKPVLYTFVGSAWAQVPRLAIAESGYKDGDVEFKEVNLVEGENFEPKYLKLNSHGTVPTLVLDGHTYDDSTNVTHKLLEKAPNPPKEDSHKFHELKKIVSQVHSEQHDPNTLLLLPVDDADREAKAKGLPAAFLGGRQKTLNKLAPEQSDFKSFLEGKQKANQGLLDLYTGNPDQAAVQKAYQTANDQWKSAGQFIRGELTHLLRKDPGQYLHGQEPGEADFHVITWFARIATDAGAKAGSISGELLPVLQKRIGSEAIDPVVAGYWDGWTQRDSFKSVKLH